MSRTLEPNNPSAFLSPPTFNLPLGRIEASLSTEVFTGSLPPIDLRRRGNNGPLPNVAAIIQPQPVSSKNARQVLNTVPYKSVTSSENRDVIRAGRVFYVLGEDVASFVPTVWRTDTAFVVKNYEGVLGLRSPGMGDDDIQCWFFKYSELDRSVLTPVVTHAPESRSSAGPTALAELALIFLLDTRTESPHISGTGPSPLLRVICPRFTVEEGALWTITWRLPPGRSVAMSQDPKWTRMFYGQVASILQQERA
ncbi:hypothetical protein FRB94_004016 [Tulasnella sp. JGI-2019a]|nr:hypothetical protein FRB93_003349 [Tulasnella sp. JGI-2019a]KAG9002274.1 hypothetical protein FRB94_004016 [Tulasnella sp. JGI-2019a]KAG9032843.1 hypothetical protein FRB95_000927 [Tulasnella sp. JGI-2019a]